MFFNLHPILALEPQAENHRATQTTWTQRLGHELADARAAEQEAMVIDRCK